MSRYFAILLAFASVVAVVPAAKAQDHIEVGAFADYFRLSDADPARNFVGVGGRAAVNIRPKIQLEAEMAYDFKRNFTRTFSDGVTSELVTRISARCMVSLVPNSRPVRGHFAFS